MNHLAPLLVEGKLPKLICHFLTSLSAKFSIVTQTCIQILHCESDLSLNSYPVNFVSLQSNSMGYGWGVDRGRELRF